MMLPAPTTSRANTVVGRFAPSPTGMLHIGSLVTAVASYLFSKAQGGKWLLRMEDLDSARNVPGAAVAILRQLEHLGLYWDGPVVYQSARMEFYTDTLHQLMRSGEVYRCTCTRREITTAATRHTPSGPVYSGRCRQRENTVRNSTANGPNRKNEHRGSWRLKVDAVPIRFTDILNGHTTQQLALEVGDFILKRADNVFAYQFATPLDDATQHITQVIRGADLLDSTPRQIYLLQRLGLPIPTFGHIPLVLDQDGNKISKSTQLLAQIDSTVPIPFGAMDLLNVLEFLGQAPPAELSNCSYGSAARCAPPKELLSWALRNFNPCAIPLGNKRINMFP